MPDIKPGRILAGAGILAFGVVGSWIAYSQFVIDHNVPLPQAVDADLRTFTSAEAGELAYYVDDSGSGRPIVLLHSINAAATTYEMKPLFEYYQGKRPVYSLELPGFGFSERSDRNYTPRLYVAAVEDFLTEIVGEEADVVALSLGSEYAAEAARNQPDYISSLVLISPTGFGSRSAPQSDVLYEAFTFPLWSQAFFDLLVIRPSLEYFLGMTFTGEIPEDFIDYSYAATHQPGARYAPLTFVTGRLFSPNIYETTYTQIDDIPVLALYGRDPDVTFDQLPEIAENKANWQAVRMEDRLPHWEALPETIEILEGFWE
jgi:pimeloyl-ACP methyl ester carboxylesterase